MSSEKFLWSYFHHIVKMFGGMNPKKMQAMMKQMGIAQEEIDSVRVIIEEKNGNKIIVENPSVVKVKMQGNESFQISGDIKQESQEIGVSPEDVKTVVEKTGRSEDEVKASLEKTGDLAQSILELSS